MGQRQDFSALVGVERIERGPDWMGLEPECVRVLYLERMPLGTPYGRVVEKARAALEGPELRGAHRLVVDATGVGAPVVEMLRGARLGCPVTAVWITGGGRRAAAGKTGACRRGTCWRGWGCCWSRVG